MTSFSSPGLNGHITKKHNENQKQQDNTTVVASEITTPVKRNVNEESIDVLNIYLVK